MVRLRASRRGIFLTFIAIILVGLLLLYSSTQYEISYKDTVPTESLRITGLNNFITDFEEIYLERALFASAHRAIAAMVNATPDGAGGSRITDPNAAFKEAMINASINLGTVQLATMQNDTLPVWIERLSNFSRDTLRVGMQFNITSVNITQDDATGPWLVNVSMRLDYRLNTSDTVWERRNITVITSFDIFGFEDPYLKFKTSARINRSIVRFNFTGENYLPENLSVLINATHFIHDRRAPSFLSRFTAFSDPASRSDCCGIFSLVASQHDTAAYTSTDRTFADFTYHDAFCFDEQLYHVDRVSSEPGIGTFYLDEYFIDKVFSLPPNETVEWNDPLVNPCGP